MAHKVDAWRSLDGRLWPSERLADEHDLQSLYETVVTHSEDGKSFAIDFAPHIDLAIRVLTAYRKSHPPRRPAQESSAEPPKIEPTGEPGVCDDPHCHVAGISGHRHNGDETDGDGA